MVWQAWLLPVLGYLIGSFPTGVVLSRIRFGIDVRDTGSGNIGATNITRTFGWKAGVITYLVDFSKGFFVMKLALALCASCPWVVPLVGFAVVLGHCYSVFLALRGGKGVATAMGVWVAAVPWVGGAMGAVYVVMLWLTRVSAWGSLAGVATAVVLASLLALPVPHRLLVYACAFVVVFRHHSNLRRLWRTE